MKILNFVQKNVFIIAEPINLYVKIVAVVFNQKAMVPCFVKIVEPLLVSLVAEYSLLTINNMPCMLNIVLKVVWRKILTIFFMKESVKVAMKHLNQLVHQSFV